MILTPGKFKVFEQCFSWKETLFSQIGKLSGPRAANPKVVISRIISCQRGGKFRRNSADCARYGTRQQTYSISFDWIAQSKQNTLLTHQIAVLWGDTKICNTLLTTSGGVDIIDHFAWLLSNNPTILFWFCRSDFGLSAKNCRNAWAQFWSEAKRYLLWATGTVTV